MTSGGSWSSGWASTRPTSSLSPSSALADLDKKSSQEAWDAAIFEYGMVTEYEQTKRSNNDDLRKRVDDFIARFQLQEKQKNNNFSVDDLFPKKEQAPDIERIFLELQQKQAVPIIQLHAVNLLDECSSMIDNFKVPPSSGTR